MTGCGQVPSLADDTTLPEEERAILDRARAIVPRLAERALAAAAARRLPPETIAEYHAAGILRILQPRRFGGQQGRFSLFSRIVEELTYGCASSAWVYAVLAEHQWIIAQYPEEAQIDVWGDDPEAVASSSLAPRAVAGGWRLSGRFPFSSGCDYAQWAIVGAFLGEMGDPRHIAYLLAPFAEIEIVDDWQVLGLAGTGSKSLVLHDVFVPEHRCVMVSDLFAGAPPGALVHPEYPVLRAPRGFLVSYSLPPVAIALGRRALDIACAVLAGRVSRWRDQIGRIRSRADGDRRGRRGDRCRDHAAAHRARIQHRGGQLGPQDHRGGGIARPARHGLRAASGELGARPPVRNERRPLGLRQRPTGRDPARRDDDLDAPRREPPGRHGALRPHVARPRRRLTATGTEEVCCPNGRDLLLCG
jgi:alkylation response protein AidB-like acyl-CoA dehydrogenase